MAQRLLHRVLLTIFFDNPNCTATITQTSFPMAQRLLHRLLFTIFFWQSQWHSDYYTDFFWQSFLTIPMAQNMIKAINILQGHKVSTKKTKSANTSAKPPKYYAQSENATWTIAGYDKSHQNIAGTQGKYEKTKNAEENAKSNKVLRTTAKMIDELLPNMIKAIKILQGHKVSTKKTKSANTSAKPKYYAQSENATWTIAGEEWSFQKTVGIQADYEGTKNANESSKATMYCAQQQKWYMNYCRIW